MRNVVIMGAGGRDFHDFNVVFRDDPEVCVAAFTAAQIPGIDDRIYPASLAGPRYPQGIPIRPEHELAEIVPAQSIDDVVLAYSDLRHDEVMHHTSIALTAGADFRLIGPRASMLRSAKPVIAVSAVRTGCGKSQTSRAIARLVAGRGLRVTLVRHPMPYGDLEAIRVQRFSSLADIDTSHPTIEDREEYEAPVREGFVVWSGVDYEAILRAAEAEADVVIWDGGNNDLPFFVPDLHVVVVDALRPGHEVTFHPGEANLRMADVVIVNKVDAASLDGVATVVANVQRVNPSATLVRCASPVTLLDGPSLVGAHVLVVEDGPTITHGGMPFGAGTVAARHGGAQTFVDPRPFAVGSIASTYAAYPTIGTVLPAMGYGDAQVRDLEATIRAAARAEACDVVVSGTPIDLTRLLDAGCPVHGVRYELVGLGEPSLDAAVGTFLDRCMAPAARTHDHH